MKIDYSNANIINSKNFYIHDDWFVKMTYERDDDCNGTINLHLKKYNSARKDFCIEFINVIGFKATSCVFWGKCSNILDMEYMNPDEQTLLPNLYDEMKNQTPINNDCKLLSDKNYIETTVYFISGDKLIIVCEAIYADDEMVKPLHNR